MIESRFQGVIAPPLTIPVLSGMETQSLIGKRNMRVLLMTTAKWFSAARLAMAMDAAGFEVDAVCPRSHPLVGIGAVRNVYGMSSTFIGSSLLKAVAASQPDLVIPCDDLSALKLFDLHLIGMRGGDRALCDLLERSLGRAESFPVLRSRADFLAAASAEGVRVPDTIQIESVEELRGWLQGQNFPVVLKADGTSGGEGVIIAHCLQDAERAFRRLRAPVSAAVAAKRAIFDKDTKAVAPWLMRHKRAVSVQAYIRGRDANIALACWQGRVLASIEVDVMHTRVPKGPAAVVKRNENGQMLAAAEKIVKRLGISGMCGLDFVTDEATNEPVLLEINARATQTCHLGLGAGHCLPAALYAAAAAQPLREPRAVTDSDVIALFPLEWQKDPASPFLRHGYHDVPWEEPSLVRLGVAKESRFTLENLLRIWAAAHRLGHRSEVTVKREEVNRG